MRELERDEIGLVIIMVVLCILQLAAVAYTFTL